MGSLGALGHNPLVQVILGRDFLADYGRDLDCRRPLSLSGSGDDERLHYLLFDTPAHIGAYLVMGGVSLEDGEDGMLFYLAPDGSDSSVTPLLDVTVHFGGRCSYFSSAKVDGPRQSVAFPLAIAC